MYECFCKEKVSEEKKSSDDFIIKNQSAFNPPRNRDKVLDQTLTLLIVWTFPICKKHPKATFQSSNGRL